MANIVNLARHWLRQTQIGKGVRLEAADVDLLNALGFGELIATKAAEAQREAAAQRHSQRESKVPEPSSAATLD